MWLRFTLCVCCGSISALSIRAGCTKPISSVPLFSYFCFQHRHVSYWISRLYLTDVVTPLIYERDWKILKGTFIWSTMSLPIPPRAYWHCPAEKGCIHHTNPPETYKHCIRTILTLLSTIASRSTRCHFLPSIETYVGPLALTNDKIYGPSNVCGPLRDRYDFQTL